MTSSEPLKARIPFSTLMALELVRDDEYSSLATPFAPGLATYGGHVLAQAVWAASHTVRPGFINMHCYFTLPGSIDRPFVYTVERIRDGGRYSTRAVKVRQPDDSGGVEESEVCFTCICSFKIDEDGGFEHQVEEGTVEERYAGVIAGREADEHDGAPVVDVPWFWAHAREQNLKDETPGVDVRKVDMGEYNAALPPEKYRQLQYYTAIGAMPDNLNLHACAHLYASDRNSLFLIANAHDIGDRFTGMGSVSHSVVFHVDSEGLRFSNGDEKTWFCQEAWTERSGGGRGLHSSKIWDRSGRHVASTWQDGMVRAAKSEDRVELSRRRLQQAVARSKM